MESKKNIVVSLLTVLVYLAFFFTHQGHSSHQVAVLGVANNLSLVQQPQDGRKILLDSIESAQKEIDVEVYLLTDKEIISSLEKANQRGVKVNVMLEEHPFGAPSLNNKTYQTLKDAGIAVSWANPAFSFTHEKAVVIDGIKAFILNQNLTAASFSKNREFDIIDTNPEDVTQIRNIFFSDAKRESITPTGPNLIVSPNNARDMIVSLLKSAKREIVIEMEVIDDKEIITLLEQAAAKIPVEVIMPDYHQIFANKKVAAELVKNKVSVRTLSSPYIHAKLIVVDKQKAYIGSVNLTTQSLDENRELGIIISEEDIITTLEKDFQTDWSVASQI